MDSSIQLEEMIQAYDQRDYHRARELVMQFLSQTLPPEDRVRAHAYHGYILEALGDKAGAMQQYREALDLHPGSWWPLHLHYMLGVALRSGGNQEEARGEFAHAIEHSDALANDAACDEFLRALCELAILEYTRGDYEAALRCADRANDTPRSANGGEGTVWFALDKVRGQACFWLERWQESIPALRSALAIVPDTESEQRPLLMCYLGLALCAIQQYGEAMNVLSQADMGEAQEPSIWIMRHVWMGNLYYLRNEFGKALEHFEHVIDRPPATWGPSRDSLARMADCYLTTGNYQRALTIAAMAYEEMHGNVLVHLEYANALAVSGRPEEARRVLEEIDESQIPPGLRERFLAHSAYVALRGHDRNRGEEWIAKLAAHNPFSRYLHSLRRSAASEERGIFHRWFRRQKS
jgi:tetratricopeptide (TPR) repeat protein